MFNQFIVFVAVIMITATNGDQSLSAATNKTNEEVCALSGQIAGDSDNQISSEVRVFKMMVSNGHSMLYPECTTQTDERGSYLCGNLSSGQYIISAQPIPPPRVYRHVSQVSLKAMYPLTFYPGTTDLSSAVPVVLRSGDALSVDIVMHKEPTYSIKGTVAGHRVVRMSLSLTLVSDNGSKVAAPVSTRYPANTSSFIVDGIPDGSYWLQARWYDYSGGDVSPLVHEDSVPLTIHDSDVEDLHLVGDSFASVQGTIETDEAPGIHVDSVSLKDVAGRRGSIAAPVFSDGHFVIPSVLPGDYFVNIGHIHSAFVAEMTVDGRIASDQKVVIMPGHSQVFLELQVDANVGTIKGSVRDGDDGCAKCGVVAQDENSGEFYIYSADEQGKFFMSGVPPGVYNLYAWRHLEDVPYADPGFLDRYTADSREVSVTEGTSVDDVELSIISGYR